MATAKRKSTKKKSSRRSSSAKKPTRKKAKKKSAKKKSTARRKKGPTLRKVPYTDYEFVWDENRDQCHFGHRGGCGGEVGCGATDSVTVFTDSKGQFYVLSVNYAEGYACVEVLDDDDDDPIVAIAFMEPHEVAEALKKDITKVPAKQLASMLAAQCM
jgi:hypothetical protein